MNVFTIEDIRSWNPCCDPSRYLQEDWSGTVVDILRIEQIPLQDRLWVVLREELIDAKTLRLFAVWCARSVEHLLTDDRSRAAIDTAERFAHGSATREELAAACAAARYAARYAARDAARSAACAAARSATCAAARDAAWEAARAAALDGAWAAARAAQVMQLFQVVEHQNAAEA